MSYHKEGNLLSYQSIASKIFKMLKLLLQHAVIASHWNTVATPSEVNYVQNVYRTEHAITAVLISVILLFYNLETARVPT